MTQGSASVSIAAADDRTVGEALAQHYRAHGLAPDGGVNDRWFRVRIGAFSIRLPNPPARRRALLLHDANHVATGYDTRFGNGELSIAAFEVGAGCGRFAIVWFINLTMFAIGLVCRPRLAVRAFNRGRQSVSIYRDPPSSDALVAMSVRELRARLGLDSFDGGAGRAGRL